MPKREAVYSIDLRDPAIAANIAGRFPILLDMNVWIDLAEKETAQASRLQTKFRDLVERGKIFCPLAPTLIGELYKQSYTSALRVAELMETLSLNVSFVPSEEIYHQEVEAVFEEIRTGVRPTIDPAMLFVPALAFIGFRAELRFPNVDRFEDALGITDQLAHQLREMSFVELCRRTKDSFSQPEESPPSYAATALRRKELAGNRRERARRIEEEEVLRSIVTPRMIELRRRLTLQDQIDICSRITTLPKDKYGGIARHLISSMPSLEHRINLLSLTGQDPGRKDRDSDFYDLELMMAPYIYSKHLVTRDRWIRHLLKKLGGRKSCIGTYEELESSLSEWDSPPVAK